MPNLLTSQINVNTNLSLNSAHLDLISNSTIHNDVNNHNSLIDHNRIMQKHAENRDFYIGLTLALLSSLFIGSSFILKKKGLLKLCGSTTISPNKRAGQGGYGYLKEWMWWSGFLTMGVGELCNFAAYGFVPATLVTPLGALSVLISAVMSAYFLNEKLNTIGKIGCILTAIGSTVMVIHAPKEGDVKSVRDLLFRIQDPEFITFTVLSIFALFVLIYVLVPRYGNTNILVYILICSILGAFTVMSCKGLSLGIKEIFLNRPSVSFVYTYMFAILVVLCIVMQMNYLNKSLDLFNTPIVTTVYYVLFTLFVMIASSLLFKEMLNLSFQDFVGCLCGFCTIICALFLIQFFRTTENEDLPNVNFDKSDKPDTSNGYDNNILNLIINSSKNGKNNLEFQDDFPMNDFNNSNANTRESSATSFDVSKQRIVSNVPQKYLNDQEPMSDLIKETSGFKVTKDTSDTPLGPASLIKKLTTNYKHLQNNYLFAKLKTGYNYNKLISDEIVDRDEEDEDNNFLNNEDEILNRMNHSDKIKNISNKKYNLLNSARKNVISSFDLKYKQNRNIRKPVGKRESKNLSFDEKMFPRENSGGESNDEANTTSTSLIILRS